MYTASRNWIAIPQAKLRAQVKVAPSRHRLISKMSVYFVVDAV
jgi:hypothetical protein